MDKETYEALKKVVFIARRGAIGMTGIASDNARDNIKQVEDWIDEVAKEYEGE
uniref:Uncharacterized protein n=1 Tax=viral metagenome TaxID=1070528 RepID=A0A6H1ZFQ3_9ZZZZ